ncbi:ROK family protein [Butyricicoccus faecihominis]|uniref:ROK family protein n=1 Tax=Butyricicoccus faecihominis TaxID=1712515 RepID=UPI00247838A5|nr:ROK family protein [Butyricicoccus faecihominis]MCQ5131416.1 ROK family protein [Butyricicoccus faecihominis]
MVLCFDIGGTSIKYGLAYDPGNEIRFAERWEIPTEAARLRGPGIERKIVELTAALSGRQELRGVAVSTAGMVDPASGKIVYANENIPGYTGCNVKAAVERAVHLPCAVENDVNAAALGEYAYGAGRGRGSMLCLTVGTGIGGAAVLNGEIWHGHAYSAGEIGYMLVNGKPFQDQAATSALIRQVAQATGEALDGRQIFQRARQGDAACNQAIDTMCAVLAQGIANCLCVLDPGMVVLGGGVMAQAAFLRPRLMEYLQRYANPYILAHTTLSFAELGNDAGMAGAYYLLMQQIKGAVK